MSSESSPRPDVTTSSRARAWCEEIQRLVREGIESSLVELTRECSLAGENRKSQADFVKTIQGIANAYPPEERVYVVGADQRERRFYALTNEREFDAANLCHILEKCLDPLPHFEAFILETDEHVKFAVIVLAPEQPRPIFIKVTTQASDGKSMLLQKGDVWIKKRTALDKATRTDFEAIYEIRIESESERRASKRVGDVRVAMEASLRLHASADRRIPSDDLILGPFADYQAYLEQLMANGDTVRFHMLATRLRDLTVERWHSIGGFDSVIASRAEQAAQTRRMPHGDEVSTKAAEEFEKPISLISDYLSSVFQPSLRRLIHAGLLLTKYDMAEDWLPSIADLLVEIHDTSEKLVGLPRSAEAVMPGVPTQGKVAVDVSVASRVLAAYVMRSRRYSYLAFLLKRFVPIGATRGGEAPLLFWPTRSSIPGNDRIAFCWSHGVEPYWLDFFGSEDSYYAAACELEFVLHLNSYLATENADASNWIEKYSPTRKFQYWYTSDLWRYPLERVVPLAESIYESLFAGPNAPLLMSLSVEQSVFQKAFQPDQQSVGHEREKFVAYLRELRSWQTQAAYSTGRFPSMVDWGPILGPLVNVKAS